ncbi:MAG: MoaD/ThiS family protein [Actinomycetota bacterium]
MKVKVVCFGAMRAYLPAAASGNSAELEVREGARAVDVIDALGAPRQLVFALLIDGEQASLEGGLRDGSEVTVMPPFAGGRP